MIRLALTALVVSCLGCASIDKQILGAHRPDIEAAMHNAHVGGHVAGERCYASMLNFIDRASELQSVGPFSRAESLYVKAEWKEQVQRDCAEVLLEARRFLFRLGILR